MRLGEARIKEFGRQVERQGVERRQAAAQGLQRPHVFECRLAKPRQFVGPLIQPMKAPVGQDQRIVRGALAAQEIGFVLARLSAVRAALR